MLNQYEIDSECLCDCGDCEVYKVRNKNNINNVLIAKIFSSPTDTYYIKERDILLNILNNVPNIINLNNNINELLYLTQTHGEHAVCLFYDYLNHGTLNDYITDPILGSDFTEDMVKFIGFKLLSAIQVIHQNHIVHNKLDENNIMLDNNYNLIIIHFKEASTQVNDVASFNEDFISLAKILLKLISNANFSQIKIQKTENQVSAKVYFPVGKPKDLNSFWEILEKAKKEISTNFKKFFNLLISGNNLNANNLLNHQWFNDINNILNNEGIIRGFFIKIYQSRLVNKDELNTYKLDYSNLFDESEKDSTSLFYKSSISSEMPGMKSISQVDYLYDNFSKLKIEEMKFKPMGKTFEYLILELSNFNYDFSFFAKFIYELYSTIDEIENKQEYNIEKFSYKPEDDPNLHFGIVINRIYEEDDFEDDDEKDEDLIIDIKLVKYKDKNVDDKNNVISNKNVFYLLFNYKEGEIGYYYYFVNIFKEKAISILKKYFKKI